MSVSDSELVGFVSLLFVDEREESVVALHLPCGSLKTLPWVAAGTEMWTQYLPPIGIISIAEIFFVAPVKMKTSFFKIIHHKMALSKS